MRGPLLALALAVLAQTPAPRAIALEPPAVVANDKDDGARAAFHEGERAEKERRYADAVASYRAVLRIDPGNFYAAAASARVQVLGLYEGAFDDLARLDEIRRDPRRADDRASIEALERAAPSFKGRPRTEALLFVAEAWVGRLHEPSRGASAALAVARDPTADGVQRDAAWDLAWAALKTDLPRAEREIGRDPGAPEAIRTRVLREVRRARLHRASTVVVATAGLGLLVAASVTASRRRWKVFASVALNPYALAFLVISPLFAARLADAWEQGFGKHFAPLATAMLAVHLLVSAWRGAFGDRGPALRLSGSLLASLAVLAAAYLVLERSEAAGTPLLQAFGL